MQGGRRGEVRDAPHRPVRHLQERANRLAAHRRTLWLRTYSRAARQRHSWRPARSPQPTSRESVSWTHVPALRIVTLVGTMITVCRQILYGFPRGLPPRRAMIIRRPARRPAPVRLVAISRRGDDHQVQHREPHPAVRFIMDPPARGLEGRKAAECLREPSAGLGRTRGNGARRPTGDRLTATARGAARRRPAAGHARKGQRGSHAEPGLQLR
jgi:hypothetical protein